MSALEKAAALLEGVQHAGLLKRWERSSAEFAYGAPLITADELDANALKPFPDRPDVRWFMDQLDTGEDICVWKSRQHFCSHACHGSHLWLAAFHRYRSIAYVAQEEQEGKDHIEERIVGMWERLPPWFTKMFKWTFKAATGVFIIEEREGEPWRSFIEPIARGSNKLRSWTYSRVHFDEAARNDHLERGYTGAYATVRGGMKADGTQKKGQFVLTTSAAYHPWLIDLTGTAFEQGLDLVRADPVRGIA